MRIGSKTDKGLVREQNEDSMGYRNNLFVVADGMGGHEAGEIASAIAVETILATDLALNIPEALGAAVLAANEAILHEAERQPSLQGMGTTVVVLAWVEDEIFFTHVGDSRIYQLTDGTLKQLTEDHSLVVELVKNGGLTADEAKNHPQRNILTRALGTKGLSNIEVQTVSHAPGDKLLLCSDGLYSLLKDVELQEILSAVEPPQTIVDRLVDLANERGGNDNITLILIDSE